MKTFLASLLIVLSAVLSACGSTPGKLNPRDDALTNYGVAIRWSEFEDAIGFIDAAVRSQQLVSDLERERLKQIQVTGYEVKSRQPQADGSIEQRVEIRLISRNTQIERIVTDRQLWRWDPEAKRYWLTTGLPDFNPE